jgi:hypothetical protein
METFQQYINERFISKTPDKKFFLIWPMTSPDLQICEKILGKDALLKIYSEANYKGSRPLRAYIIDSSSTDKLEEISSKFRKEGTRIFKIKDYAIEDFKEDCINKEFRYEQLFTNDKCKIIFKDLKFIDDKIYERFISKSGDNEQRYIIWAQGLDYSYFVRGKNDKNGVFKNKNEIKVFVSNNENNGQVFFVSLSKNEINKLKDELLETGREGTRIYELPEDLTIEEFIKDAKKHIIHINDVEKYKKIYANKKFI